ncbi:ABC transporter ATP-binding protein [Lactococcus nasutitermitis]|uniref:ABC transporter ATP-binding protein n=1 Tax=Lactococcus nasutitermitis TaxID=1652957 RepID=A0ABV9JGN1_9LACT|nr:ATP-binding cassette domain-containing protein [Lactococcus nasutitermitis]
MTKNMIRVSNVIKSFGDKEVLKGVDFEVKEGEVYALLGSNGAGKTTMINILATLLTADSGTAMVNGYDVVKEAQNVRDSIALTGQFSALDEFMTGRENLLLMANLWKVPNAREKVEEVLDKVGMTSAADKRVKSYSGGMKRRVDIAMGLISARSVLFLDEPTTGLDPEARYEVYEVIKELKNEGTTIVLTTQYLKEAEELADKIAILHGGQIVVEGDFSELQAQHHKEHGEKNANLEDIFIKVVKKGK